MDIAYKSFCWSLGTTSFRMKNFNKAIEEQLALLQEFWSLPTHANDTWSAHNDVQAQYYDFLHEKGFVEGNARNKPKDAREKTSGLVALGLVDDQRRLTPVGEALLSVSRSGDFASDNQFAIDKDSYMYLKQLMKTSVNVGTQAVRPFLVLLSLLDRFDFLTLDEFTYLLPLCIGKAETEEIVAGIEGLRVGRGSVDEIIVRRLMAMDNYQAALDLFLSNPVTPDLVCEIGLNRKSRQYDKDYYPLYQALYRVFVTGDISGVAVVYNATKNLKLGRLWRNYLFTTASYAALVKSPGSYLRPTMFTKLLDGTVGEGAGSEILAVAESAETPDVFASTSFEAAASTAAAGDECFESYETAEGSKAPLTSAALHPSSSCERAFKQAFFEVMHLLKAKATLSDYLDLNRRYIKTTDVVLFEDGLVRLDIVPKYFFRNSMPSLASELFVASSLLPENCTLEVIAPGLCVDDTVIIQGINRELGLAVTSLEAARQALEDNRYCRLHHLIDTLFTDDTLIELLGYFETRQDDKITALITDNADIPTLFEYVLGILWYKVSERQGKILDYMKLSLDADLLPKTHASGGEADIVYEYPATETYPEHVLLLEATLADRTNQRRMEMEPVSRHLGNHLLRTGNPHSYCLFATNYLDINVISDFRGRKTLPFYDPQDYTRFVPGMKIIPLEVSALKQILRTGKTYRDLYLLFEAAHQSDLPPHEWYESAVEQTLLPDSTSSL